MLKVVVLDGDVDKVQAQSEPLKLEIQLPQQVVVEVPVVLVVKVVEVQQVLEVQTLVL